MIASRLIRPLLTGKLARAILALPFLTAAFGTANAQPTFQPTRITNTALPFGPARIMSSPENAIYADPAIQAELELTDAQKATLKRIPEEIAAKYKGEYEKEMAEANAAREKATAQNQENQKKADALIEKHLTESQRKRFKQLGSQALMNSNLSGLWLQSREMFEGLSLTEAQKAQLRELVSSIRGNTLPGPGGSLRVGNTEAMRKIARETMEKFVPTLSPNQQAAWKEMIGEPIDAAKFLASVPTNNNFNTILASKRLLLGNPKLLDELKLDEAKRKALLADWSEFQNELNKADRTVGWNPGFQQQAISKAVGEAYELAGQTLTPAQTKRLDQIRFQLVGIQVFATSPFAWMGMRVISPVELLTRLTLTPLQAQKLAGILEAANSKFETQAIPMGFSFTPQSLNEQQRQQRLASELKNIEIERKAFDEIMAIFDGGQKEIWGELTGKRLDLTKFAGLRTISVSLRSFGGGRGQSPYSSISGIWNLESRQRLSRGHYAAALAAMDQALQLDPGNPVLLLNKATVLASAPADLVRDGKTAVEIARNLVEGKPTPNFAEYQVLAAAYAETGQFDEAVKAQEKAISLIASKDAGKGPTDYEVRIKPEYQAQLKLYQEKKPYRLEPPSSIFNPR